MEPTPRDMASFEAGIKLGAVFHQFVGTPVRPSTADELATAMENAMQVQPACVEATVHMDREAIAADVNRFDYTGLAGHHLTIEVIIEHEGHRVEAELVEVDDYPLMRLVDIGD